MWTLLFGWVAPRGWFLDGMFAVSLFVGCVTLAVAAVAEGLVETLKCGAKIDVRYRLYCFLPYVSTEWTVLAGGSPAGGTPAAGVPAKK